MYFYSTTCTYCKVFITGLVLVLEYFSCSKGSEYFTLDLLSDPRLHSVMNELLLHVLLKLSLLSRLHLQRTLRDEELLVKIGHDGNMAAALLQRLRRCSRARPGAEVQSEPITDSSDVFDSV